MLNQISLNKLGIPGDSILGETGMTGNVSDAGSVGTSSAHVPNLKPESEDPCVKGRLKASLSFWKHTLNATAFILNVIELGYILPLHTTPSPCKLRNNKSSIIHPDFVGAEIGRLLRHKYIEEVREPPYCCNPLTVVEGKKLRLVLDLNRNLNHCLSLKNFKYEDLAIVSELIEEHLISPL